MATFVTANENAKKEFEIPVSWQVFDQVRVQANSLEEAYEYVRNHLDDIPLGDDESYVDGSYEIAADNIEGCIGYQSMNDVICLSFECDDLEKYVDSMLFDSGTVIAKATFQYKCDTYHIELKVCGEVSVTYKGETFYHASEFPEELIHRIKTDPEWFMYAPTGEENDDREGDIQVTLNNWFEYVPDFGDGVLMEADRNKVSAEDILDDMRDIIRKRAGLD